MNINILHVMEQIKDSSDSGDSWNGAVQVLLQQVGSPFPADFFPFSLSLTFVTQLRPCPPAEAPVPPGGGGSPAGGLAVPLHRGGQTGQTLRAGLYHHPRRRKLFTASADRLGTCIYPTGLHHQTKHSIVQVK